MHALTCSRLGAVLRQQQAPRQAQQRVVAVVRRAASLQFRREAAVRRQLACTALHSYTP